MVRKEVQNGVFSLRFIVVFGLLILVVPVSILILTNDYVKKVDEHSYRRSGTEEYLKSYAHFNRLQNVIRPVEPPLPALTLVRGLSSDVNLDEFDDDPLPVMFPLLDLVFVVTVLLSLAALIFSYDAVCGEKEEGTLRLMLANSVPRSKIVLAKIAGGMITLFIPFLVSVAFGLSTVVLNPRVSWTGANWGALALLLAGATVVVFFFHTLGTLVSALHHASASSIMTSLCLWVILVLAVPNLSPYAASLLSPAPSRIKTSREISRLTGVDRDDLGRKLQAERMSALVKKYPVLAERLTEAEAKERVSRDPAYREASEARTREVQAAWDEANRIQTARARALEADLRGKEEAQTRLSRDLSLASPLADFTYFATDVTSTGLRDRAHFAELSGLWDGAYWSYVRAKIDSLQKKDPAVDWWNTPVDVSDMPRFQYTEEALGTRVKAALTPLLVLLILSSSLFVAAYVAFIAYDAR